MSVLDKLKQSAVIASGNVNVVANKAVEKSKTAVSIANVKISIAKEEDRLKRAYTEIGRLYYRDYNLQIDIDQNEYTPWFEKVAESVNILDRLTNELERLITELHSDTPIRTTDSILEDDADVEAQITTPV